MANQKVQWNSILALCKKISNSALEKGHQLVPVRRGGLVPCSLLAYYSGAAIVDEGTKRFIEEYNSEFPEDVIFVDEFLDTGATFRKLAEKYPKAKFCFLYVRSKTWNTLTKEEQSKIIVKPYGIAHSNWLDFPWEEK